MTPNASLTRRAALRLLGGAALAVVPVGVAVRGAAADGILWCRTDPKLLIGGEKVEILIAATTPTIEGATGPVRLVIRVPVGTEVEVLETDAGFGQGYDIAIEEAATLRENPRQIFVEVAAYVPATDDTQPILLEVVHKGSHAKPADDVKHTNKWLTVRTKLKTG